MSSLCVVISTEGDSEEDSQNDSQQDLPEEGESEGDVVDHDLGVSGTGEKEQEEAMGDNTMEMDPFSSNAASAAGTEAVMSDHIDDYGKIMASAN